LREHLHSKNGDHPPPPSLYQPLSSPFKAGALYDGAPVPLSGGPRAGSSSGGGRRGGTASCPSRGGHAKTSTLLPRTLTSPPPHPAAPLPAKPLRCSREGRPRWQALPRALEIASLPNKPPEVIALVRKAARARRRLGGGAVSRTLRSPLRAWIFFAYFFFSRNAAGASAPGLPAGALTLDLFFYLFSARQLPHCLSSHRRFLEQAIIRPASAPRARRPPRPDGGPMA